MIKLWLASYNVQPRRAGGCFTPMILPGWLVDAHPHATALMLVTMFGFCLLVHTQSLLDICFAVQNSIFCFHPS